jgi:hypothetical protein
VKLPCKNRRFLVLLALAALLLLMLPVAASADIFYFDGLQPLNMPTDTAIGQNQFAVEVTAGPTINDIPYVNFTFTNKIIAPSWTFQPSSITDVYFWDGSFFTKDYAITYSSGVEFIAGGVPQGMGDFTSVAGLPKASLVFCFKGFGSTQPTPQMGVDSPAEWLTLSLGVNPYPGLSALETVLATLDNWEGLGSTSTIPYWDGNTMSAIGLFAQAFADGGSERFVDLPGGEFHGAPIPATALLLGSGLVGLGLMGWRRRRQN